MKKIILLITFPLFFQSNYSHGQCTEAKDPEMAKYMNLTKTQDAQGCSQCGMLALYFCSATYCVKQEDITKVGGLINACKQNIINMGQPYCCPDYLNKAPNWGAMAGAAGAAGSGTAANSFGMSNPMTNSNSNSNYNSSQILNSLSNLNPSNSSLSSYAKNYAQGQQIADVATGLYDLFKASPEEQARKEQARLAAQKQAETNRQNEIKLIEENKNKAQQDFNYYLNKLDSSKEDNRAQLVINIMDNYITKKYYYDARNMIPNWKSWMNEAIQNNNKYVTTVFAGKTLGLNNNMFDYKLDLQTDQAIKLLEKVANSEPEYRPFFGVSWDVVKKTIKEKNKKMKVVSKEINTYKIKNVAEGTTAFNMGLINDDIIVKINNEYFEDFIKKIQNYKIDSKISVTYLRNQKEFTKEGILGKKEADSYNVDAMLFLANYYNNKESGNNPEKSIYFFTKAAEKGSPNAMYALGQIYQYLIFGNKNNNVKYKFKKNPEFALEWYSKSILNPSYNISAIKSLYNIGTDFEPKSFDELITMYQKGIGCEKNLAKANEIAEMKKNYENKIISKK